MNDIDSSSPVLPTPPSAMPTHRSLAEWLTLLVATVILTLLVGLILYDWRVNQTYPPAFEVTVADTVRVTDGQYYLPFVITNTGGRIARTVQVVADLQLADGFDESGEQQIDFLSGHESKRGSFVFTHHPQEGELVVRVASYLMP
jgi:uncharacterized protein (TIGR02588 family)